MGAARVSHRGVKSFRRTRAGFRGLNFTIAWRRVRYQRGEQFLCRRGDFVYGTIKRELVSLGRLSEATELAHKLH